MTEICLDPKSYQYLSEWNPIRESHKAPNKQVVTVFLQKDDKILVLQRARKDVQYKLWGIPGGKLNSYEAPLAGLIREVYEETEIKLSKELPQLLGTAISCTPCDGQYGLYVYHALITDQVNVQIDLSEHLEYRWVTIHEFQALDLLTAQREAFRIVEKRLEQAMG